MKIVKSPKRIRVVNYFRIYGVMTSEGTDYAL